MPSPSSPPRFCSDCGARLVNRTVEGRTRRFCPSCSRPVYRNPRPCAGVLVRDGHRVLLVKRSNPPGVGTWSTPAGFMEVDESPAETAVRELEEETNVAVDADALSLHDVVHRRTDVTGAVVVVVYLADAESTRGSVVAGDDAADARFWSLSALADAGETVEPGHERSIRQALSDCGRR